MSKASKQAPEQTTVASTTEQKAVVIQTVEPQTATAATPAPQTAQVQAATKPTEAERIWAEIKNRPLSLYAVQGRTVKDYCKTGNMVTIEPSHCFIIPTSGAVLPALEEVVGPNYVCEIQGKYIAISRKVQFGRQ